MGAALPKRQDSLTPSSSLENGNYKPTFDPILSNLLSSSAVGAAEASNTNTSPFINPIYSGPPEPPPTPTSTPLPTTSTTVPPIPTPTSTSTSTSTSISTPAQTTPPPQRTNNSSRSVSYWTGTTDGVFTTITTTISFDPENLGTPSETRPGIQNKASTAVLVSVVLLTAILLSAVGVCLFRKTRRRRQEMEQQAVSFDPDFTADSYGNRPGDHGSMEDAKASDHASVTSDIPRALRRDDWNYPELSLSGVIPSFPPSTPAPTGGGGGGSTAVVQGLNSSSLTMRDMSTQPIIPPRPARTKAMPVVTPGMTVPKDFWSTVPSAGLAGIGGGRAGTTRPNSYDHAQRQRGPGVQNVLGALGAQPMGQPQVATILRPHSYDHAQRRNVLESPVAQPTGQPGVITTSVMREEVGPPPVPVRASVDGSRAEGVRMSPIMADILRAHPAGMMSGDLQAMSPGGMMPSGPEMIGQSGGMMPDAVESARQTSQSPAVNPILHAIGIPEDVQPTELTDVYGGVERSPVMGLGLEF